MKEKTRFLNVDLDIESKNDLEAIIKDLGERIFILQNVQDEGINSLFLELTENLPDNPEAVILKFVEVIKSLSSKGKEAWDKAYKKDFNLGYQAGSKPYTLYNQLSTATINSISELGASIGITVYALEQTKKKKKRRKKSKKK